MECKFTLPNNEGKAIWEITHQCNYNCSYCIFSCNSKKIDGELTTEECYHIIDELVLHNFKHLKITGGEPFVRKDILEIIKINPYKHINANGFLEILSDEKGEYFAFSKEIVSSIEKGDIFRLITLVYKKLNLYFSKIDGENKTTKNSFSLPQLGEQEHKYAEIVNGILAKFSKLNADSIIEKILEKKDVEPSLASFFRSLVNIVLSFVLIICVIGVLGIETTSFVALFASAGVAIGMALSGTLQNFAGGVMILLFKPFKVGDYIDANGQSGTVKEIQIFNTIINY